MFRKLLPHAAMIMAFMYFVFFFIDKVNTAMNFVNNNLTKGILFAMCVLVVIESIVMIADNRRRERRANEQRQRRPAAPAPRPASRAPQPRRANGYAGEAPRARQASRAYADGYDSRPASARRAYAADDRPRGDRDYAPGPARSSLYADERYDRYRGARSRFTEDGSPERTARRTYENRTANYGQKRDYY